MKELTSITFQPLLGAGLPGDTIGRSGERLDEEYRPALQQHGFHFITQADQLIACQFAAVDAPYLVYVDMGAKLCHRDPATAYVDSQASLEAAVVSRQAQPGTGQSTYHPLAAAAMLGEMNTG